MKRPCGSVVWGESLGMPPSQGGGRRFESGRSCIKNSRAALGRLFSLRPASGGRGEKGRRRSFSSRARWRYRRSSWTLSPPAGEGSSPRLPTSLPACRPMPPSPLNKLSPAPLGTLVATVRCVVWLHGEGFVVGGVALAAWSVRPSAPNLAPWPTPPCSPW